MTALRYLSPFSMGLISAVGERSFPMSLFRGVLLSSYVGQSSSVCWGMFKFAPHLQHSVVFSAPILRKYSPKQPCPVSTCVSVYVNLHELSRAYHCWDSHNCWDRSQLLRIASIALLLLVPGPSNSSLHFWRAGQDFPFSYSHRPSFLLSLLDFVVDKVCRECSACRSRGIFPASVVTARYETVR